MDHDRDVGRDMRRDCRHTMHHAQLVDFTCGCMAMRKNGENLLPCTFFFTGCSCKARITGLNEINTGLISPSPDHDLKSQVLGSYVHVVLVK